MRKVTLIAIVISVLFTACVNNVEEPGFDCSVSDLTIEVISSVRSGCQNPGQITVRAAGGDSTYQYSIDGENFQSSPEFNDLFAGSFTIQTMDGLGCIAEVDFNLESEPTGITLDLQSSASDCDNPTGSITAIASGGVGELQFSLDNGAFGSVSFFDAINTGDYEVRVRDEEGCEVSKSVNVNSVVSLSNDIMPIIRSNCAISGCHRNARPPELSDPSDVIRNAGRIKSETQSRSMPRNRTLTQDQIDQIACWVDGGALEN